MAAAGIIEQYFTENSRPASLPNPDSVRKETGEILMLHSRIEFLGTSAEDTSAKIYKYRISRSGLKELTDLTIKREILN